MLTSDSGLTVELDSHLNYVATHYYQKHFAPHRDQAAHYRMLNVLFTQWVRNNANSPELVNSLFSDNEVLSKDSTLQVAFDSFAFWTSPRALVQNQSVVDFAVLALNPSLTTVEIKSPLWGLVNQLQLPSHSKLETIRLSFPTQTKLLQTSATDCQFRWGRDFISYLNNKSEVVHLSLKMGREFTTNQPSCDSDYSSFTSATTFIPYQNIRLASDQPQDAIQSIWLPYLADNSLHPEYLQSIEKLFPKATTYHLVVPTTAYSSDTTLLRQEGCYLQEPNKLKYFDSSVPPSELADLEDSLPITCPSSSP